MSKKTNHKARAKILLARKLRQIKKVIPFGREIHLRNQISRLNTVLQRAA